MLACYVHAANADEAASAIRDTLAATEGGE